MFVFFLFKTQNAEVRVLRQQITALSSELSSLKSSFKNTSVCLQRFMFVGYTFNHFFIQSSLATVSKGISTTKEAIQGMHEKREVPTELMFTSLRVSKSTIVESVWSDPSLIFGARWVLPEGQVDPKTDPLHFEDTNSSLGGYSLGFCNPADKKKEVMNLPPQCVQHAASWSNQFSTETFDAPAPATPLKFDSSAFSTNDDLFGSSDFGTASPNVDAPRKSPLKELDEPAGLAPAPPPPVPTLSAVEVSEPFKNAPSAPEPSITSHKVEGAPTINNPDSLKDSLEDVDISVPTAPAPTPKGDAFESFPSPDDPLGSAGW